MMTPEEINFIEEIISQLTRRQKQIDEVTKRVDAIYMAFLNKVDENSKTPNVVDEPVKNTENAYYNTVKNKFIIINGETFNMKKEIVDRCEKIKANNPPYKILTGDDLKFMLEIFKYYPHPELKGINDIQSISVRPLGRHLCFYVMDNKNMLYDVSYPKAVNNIVFEYNLNDIDIDGSVLDYSVIDFGKYNGKSLKEIFEIDKRYLKWLYEQTWTNQIMRGKIYQLFNTVHINDIA